MDTNYKLAAGGFDSERPFSHGAVFAYETMSSGAERIVAGNPGGDPAVFARLIREIEPPFYLLYVLHTPRSEVEPGRYQSPLLEAAQLFDILDRYGGYFQSDGRHHLWVFSPEQEATVVWDNHNMIFAYGPLKDFERAFREMGFQPGPRPSMDFEHLHFYRSEFDEMADQLLDELDWEWSELRDGDD